MRDFEDWEDHHAFHQSGDYKGLVAYCEADFRRYVVFTVTELLEYLRADARFLIVDDGPDYAQVKLAPKRRSRKT